MTEEAEKSADVAIHFREKKNLGQCERIGGNKISTAREINQLIYFSERVQAHNLWKINF